MTAYDLESRALDAEILGVIERWHYEASRSTNEAFDDLALRLFAYQVRYNEPYARYCAALGVTSPRSVGANSRRAGCRVQGSGADDVRSGARGARL